MDYMQGMRLALQIIAALITIGIMAAIHQGLDGFLRSMTPQFVYGAFVGAGFVTALWSYAQWADRSAVRRGDAGPEQERSRHTIDL